MKYIDVVIDNKSRATDRFYTYGCQFDVQVGSKVYVKFGKGDKPKDAYVFGIRPDDYEPDFEVKLVEGVDEAICLSEEIMELCRFMHDRYLCKLMDAVRLFLPVGKPRKRGTRKDPIMEIEGEPQLIEKLTEDQEKVLGKISENLEEGKHEIFLIHGVTGSGKTEVYMQAISKVLERGQNAIMLVPEISLTKQIVDRFIARFGKDQLAIQHSKLSPGERYDQWQKIKSGQVRVVVGARSAIFAPLENVGVVIMDEEHEQTYKSDMSPKYDTIELAIKRTKPNKGIIILGSATPSVVSYRRSQEGIYTLLELTKRYNKVELPEVDIVDMRKELQDGNVTMISRNLFSEMDKVLSAGEQVILFMNRRGYAPFVSCRECGHVPKCPKCGISLTYHKSRNACICHYCDYKIPMPKVCPECGSRFIKGFGVGTEKVVETVSDLFPDMPVARLDLDTMKNKGAGEKILKEFGEGKTKILIGTQVVAKGLDFRNVGLVGVISCDVMLNIPDYRSPERTFQLVTQAAGRAGRGDKKGKVVIQTYTPDHYAVLSAAKQDFLQFYKDEIVLREAMLYPPFADIIQIVFSSKDENTCREECFIWQQQILEMGVDPRFVVRAKDPVSPENPRDYKECLMIKSMKGQRKGYMNRFSAMKEEALKRNDKCSIIVDVNPYSLWRI